MIDVVIVNWNSGELLESCIKTVISEKDSLVKNIYVIDNNSSDNSVEFLGNFNEILLIKNNENIGFGAACNQGGRIATAKYILFLNPDSRIFKETLSSTLNFMERKENSSIGICGVQQIDLANQVAKTCSRFPTPRRLLFKALGADKAFPKLGVLMSDWDHASTRRVDQVIGAFFFVRTNVFTQLSGFDESFFVYYEEVDFSYRAKLLGWDSVYFAGAQAFHEGGGSSKNIKAKRLFYSLRSRIVYAHKHFGQVGFFVTLTATLIIEPFSRCSIAALKFSASTIKETLLGFVMLYKWLPKWCFRGSTR